MLYPDADTIRVVLDNLNTHTAGALYETFAPDEARRLAMAMAVPISARVGGMRLTISSPIGRCDWMEYPRSPWMAPPSQIT